MAKTTASLKAMAKDSKTKKPRAPKQPETTKAPQKMLSTEFVDESDEESEEGSDSDTESLPKHPAALTNNGKAPAPDGSSSSSENDSDSEESSEEVDTDAEGSEEEEKVAEVAKPAKEVAKTQIPSVAVSNAPTTYKPPPGFESSSIRDATQVSETFKKSHLAGKQIWYFTAPASVPISSIQSMSLQKVENGESVLSHNGNDYAFSQDKAEERSYTTLMVPSSDSGYKSVLKQIDQVLHLGQVVKLPGSENGGASKATVPQKKPVRQQPKGLRMRFLPIGFGEGEAGELGSSSDSDVEMEEVPKKFRKPILTDSTSSQDDDEARKTPKKSQKHVELSSDASLDEDEEMIDAPPLQSTAEKPSKSSKSEKSVKSATNGTSKRKHGEEPEKRSKKSLSQVTIIPSDMQLKRQKTKQTKSQKDLADKPLASTNPRGSNTPIPPPKPKSKSILTAKHSLQPSQPPLSPAVPDISRGSQQKTQPQVPYLENDNQKQQRGLNGTVVELERADSVDETRRDSEKKEKKLHKHRSQLKRPNGIEIDIESSLGQAEKHKNETKDKSRKPKIGSVAAAPSQDSEGKKKKREKSSQSQLS